MQIELSEIEMLRSTLFLCVGLLVVVSAACAQEQEKKQEQQEQEAPELTKGPEDAAEKVEPGDIDEDASKEFKTTDSGLKYRILRKGDKDAKPTAENRVTVHYKGWLDDKTIFDSSYRRGETISFALRGVIPGWTEGLQLVGKGGMIELEIPPELGYGRQGGGPIPPNATLHFLVELFEIE